MSQEFLDNMGDDADSILEGEFAEPVILTYESGSEEIVITTTGIFDETYEAVDENGMGFQSEDSRVTVYETAIESGILSKLVENEEDNWQATIRGDLYRVKIPERDGTGIILLNLRNA